MRQLKRNFESNGYVKIKNFCSKQKISKNIVNKFYLDLDKEIKKSEFKKLGGALIGNLNVDPGRYGPAIFNFLKKRGLKKIIKDITGKSLSSFDVIFGGNLCLPYGHNQHFHTDGGYNDKMILVSIATSDVDLKSGPTEIVKNSHKKNIKYWKFLIQKKKYKKLTLSFGDLLVRNHFLWHRGTKNLTKKNRFLIAFLLFDKSRGIKKQKVNSSIKIYDNFLANSIFGKLKEFSYVYFKLIFVIYKVILSIIRK